MEALIPILKEFGFPIALCGLLLIAISRQNAQLVKAYTDRIGTLEKIVRGLTEKVDELERDRIRRADEYGHTLKDLALRWSTTIREHNDLTRSTLAILRKLTDSITIRPCMMDRYEPHVYPTPRPPSSDEIPKDPARAETDRLQSHG
jgi:hypothetical protein